VDRPYVEWVRVENYRCIKSADLHLTPLHALIGPNDSGKSSLLRAIAEGQMKAWAPALRGGLKPNSSEWNPDEYPNWRSGPLAEGAKSAIYQVIGPRQILRLHPDSMRAPMQLIPRRQPLAFDDEKGRGLPALYDALLTRDIPAFVKIDTTFKTLFPTVRALRMHNHDHSHKQIGLTLVDGTEVNPDEMSEGMLYWLAFAIIDQLAPQAILLIEEPENGLHPARITEVVKILREVSKRSQIVLATHSPLVINELQPEEVTIVTRTAERGTICTPMKDTIDFGTREKIYALGELWLSFADGKVEEDLVPESEREPVKE